MTGQWRAFPLIYTSCGGPNAAIRVASDARDALLSVDMKKMGILGLFGPPASGKRLLLHTLLEPQDVDFSDASTSKRNVLLWLWLCQDDSHESGDTGRVILAAGSSLEAENEQQAEDQKLALLLLLSSALLYNADGEINSQAVDRLQWAEKLPKVLRVKAMQDEEAVANELHNHAPKFVWLIRNAKLKWLKDAEGQKLTPTQYLEHSLAPEQGYGEAATHRNMLRMCLESYFPVRKCVALSRAMEGAQAVAPETNPSELRAQFVEAVKELGANYLSSHGHHLPSKKLMGQEVRSDQFVTMLDVYVDAMNAKELPTIQKAHNVLLEQEITQAFQVATQSYNAAMQTLTSSKQQGNDTRAHNERELQFVHIRSVQAAMARIYEVRSDLPAKLQSSAFEDKVSRWEAQVKREFEATRERNAIVSRESCTQLLERVLPRNLETMTSLLAERPREDFSDGLVRLLMQYRSDLRSAIDEYAQLSNGPAKAACLEKVLLETVSTSIEKWSTMVLGQYQVHLRSWHEEKQQLDRALELAKVHESDTSASASDQKHSHEKHLAEATEQLSAMRCALHRDLHSKEKELERLKTELSTMKLKHDVRVKNAESDLAWARNQTKELKAAIAVDRERKEELAAAAKQVLETQRSFHQEERSLLVQQKELLAQIVQLERQLVHTKTNHAAKVFALQNEHTKKLDNMRIEQVKMERRLKSQTKRELSSLKAAHELDKKAMYADHVGLDKEIAEIRDKLAAYEAEEEKARAAAAASRDFFKSMPMMSLPLMQAPIAIARKHQPVKRLSEASDYTTSVRFSSLDDTSTSSASPIARTGVSHRTDVCK